MPLNYGQFIFTYFLNEKLEIDSQVVAIILSRGKLLKSKLREFT